jgi:hypothetical protein
LKISGGFDALYRAASSFGCRALDVRDGVYGHCGFVLFQFETEFAQHGESLNLKIYSRSR